MGAKKRLSSDGAMSAWDIGLKSRLRDSKL